MADTSAKVIITAQDATTAGLRSVERNLRGMQKEAQSLSGSLKSMAGALGISLGVSTAISGIQRFVSSTIELADSMGKTAEQTGMTIEEISALRFAAEQADVEFSSLQSGLVKFNRTIAEAGSGNKAARDAFLQLGISMETVKAIKSEDLFMLVAQRVSELGSEADRTKALVDVFGRSGADLAPLFSQGAEGIAKAKEAAKELGVIISGEANDKVRKLGDQADLLSKKWDAFATNLLGKSAPTIIRALDAIQKQMERPFFEQFLRNLSGVTLAEMGAAIAGMGTEAASGSVSGIINRTAPGAKPSGELIDTGASEAAQKALKKAEEDQRAAWEMLDASSAKRAQWMQQTETDLQKVQREMQDFENTLIDLLAGGDISEQEAKFRWLDYLDKMLPEIEVKMKKLGKSTEETSSLMQSIAEQAGRNMQDAFAQFLFDPFKGGLSGMLKGFVTTVRQMIAQAASAAILKQFFGWMSNLGGGFGKLGAALLGGMGKAIGGSVMSNRAYMVGERGPELFVPSSGGSIVPNNRMGGGVTIAPVYNVDARGASADLVKALPAILEANTRRAVELARATIYDDYSRGAFGRA